ncbi:MAG: hypothetical protein RL441_601 [Actinomycetota bacterium]|jgi:putative ATPase
MFNTDSATSAPLAVRMRPRRLEDLVGQREILAPGTPLRRLLDGDSKAAVSVILWGPPGTGKTTLASMIAGAGNRSFVELSAISSGVKDVREVIEKSKMQLATSGVGTVLFIDEVHRFNKSQQDALLPAVENGWVTLVAATTENPSFSINAPLLSRSVVVRLRSLVDDEIAQLLERALSLEVGLNSAFTVDDLAEQMLVRLSGGDARSALTLLEASAGMAAQSDFVITAECVSSAAQRAVVVYDKDGDQHYDVISAFIKSMRGSDVDASLHYLARMLEAGEDPRFISRRIVILASEDIGMADSTALQTAIAAHQAVSFIGMPEAGLTLAHAVVHCALAPKSNAVTVAIEKARADVRKGRGRQIPAALRDAHYAGATKLGHGVDYIYPHDLPAGVAAFDYLPQDLRGARYFEPSGHGAEARWALVVEHLRALLRGESVGSPPASASATASADAVQPVEKS